MNWLNKIDNVLDSVLLPKSNDEEEEFDVPIDEIYDDNIDEITDLRTTYTNEQIPSNSSLTNGVEDQNQPVNISLHAMGRARIRGSLPNPGMIRPVLRDVLSDEDDSDGESSYVDTDDEQNLDYKANASNVIHSTDNVPRHPIETVDQEISTEDVGNDPVSPIKSPPMIYKPVLTPNKVPLPSLIRESSSLSSSNISKKPAPPKHVFPKELPAPVQKLTANNDDQQEGQGDNVDVEFKEPKASLVSDDPIQSIAEEVPKKRMPPPPPPLSANSTPSRSKTKIPNNISSPPPPPPPPKPTLTSSNKLQLEHHTEKIDGATDTREFNNYTKTESVITQQSSNFQDDISDNEMNIEEEISANATSPSTPLNDLVMRGDTLGEEESETRQLLSQKTMTKSESMMTQGNSVQDTISESDFGAQQIYSKNKIVEGSDSKMTVTALKEDDMEIDEEADELYRSDTMDALLPVKSLDMSRGTSVDTFGSMQQFESIDHEDTVEAEKGSSPSPKASFLSGGFFNGILPGSKSINEDTNKEKEETQDVRIQQTANTAANMDTTIDSNVNTTMDSNDSEQQQYNAIEGMTATFGDFLPSSTYDDYDDREDSSHHTSMTELEGSEYLVSGSTEWEHNESIDDLDPDYVPPFHHSMNCHGVVHVRVLRAQHLPCSVDSSLQVIYSLQPWNGRVRSERASSYKGPSAAGICARWDRPRNGKENKIAIDNDNTDGTISMVHAYNSEETPVPNILIQLKESALMFEREVRSMLLSCKPLMSQPGVFHRRWCVVEKKSKNNSNEERQKETKPTLFLVEACFEPSHNGEDSSNEHQTTVTLDVPSPEVENKEETRNRCDTHNSSDVSLSQHSVRTKVTSVGTMKRLTSKPHLFRNYTSIRPTYCAICNTMIAWKLKGYQCEVCRIDCCTDCQLRIDVELPCGSEKAKEAVKKSFEGKLSLAKIYEVVAPKKLSEEDQESNKDAGGSSKHSDKNEWKDGVGTFTIRIKSACIFRSHFPPETDLRHILEVNDRLRSGDYYARVSWTDSKKTRRTKTVFQSAKPIFDSDDIVVTSLHYGTEFKIEVIDASTDLCIGSKLLTTQGLLQWQRDNIGWGLSFSSLLNEEPLQLKRRPARFELRDNVKTGFGLDFYNASKISETERAGEISGWIDVDLSFEENKDLYSLSHPKPCPVRPADDFNVELIQLHVARMTAIFEDFQNFAESYKYVVSWKNPALTSLSLLLFVSLTIKFNAEYSGCLPFAFLIIYMVYSGHTRRKHGGFKVRLLKKETEEKVKELKGTSINYQKHRPAAQISISIPKGRNFGVGSTVANIVWDGLKFANESTKTSITTYDPTSSAIYPIGETEGSGVTSSPEWGVILPSNELERMKQLLPSQNFLSRTHSGSLLSESEFLEEQNKLSRKTLTFPVLQPIALGATNSSVDVEDLEEDDSHNDVRILPWKESKGALVVQVRFADVLNKLTMFDQVLGDVVIPFSKIAADGKVEGWFQVLEKGTLRTVEEPELMENEDETSTNENMNETEDENDPEASEVRPAIFLKAVVKFPNSRLASDIDKETSVVVAEQLIRISKAKKENGLGFLGTSINTFNTVTGVRGNIQNIQNQLGDALDEFEMIKNLFNFTCPEKSGLILICSVILWYILCIIPTRVLILVGGLAQYGVTFKAEFYSNLPIQSIDADTVEQNDEYDPILTRLMNFLSGIPTDEDLRRYYFWEAIQVGEREREVLAQTKRSTRLTKLWKAQWFGKVQLKVQNTFASESGRRWDWKSIFCIIQGHRFVWWNSEKDFDDGENPSGQIFFAGHSGLAGLSPLEMRELKPNEVPLVISIFGRGSTIGGQQTKVTLLTQDTKVKDSLELAVLHASMDIKKD